MSWKKYCKKYNITLHISETPLPDNSNIRGNDAWQPWILDESSELFSSFEKFLIVDADTFISNNAPDVFDITKDQTFSVVRDGGTVQSGKYHLAQWKGFGSETVDPANYFNTGFICLDQGHYNIIKSNILPYYEEWVRQPRDAWEQSPVNIIAHSNFDDISYLGDEWNNIVVKKISFSANDGSYIWHFAGMYNDQRIPLMRDLHFKFNK